MEQTEKSLNIYEKLAKIRKPISVIKKNKAGFGYKYVTEEEILSKISGLMEKLGVSLVPKILPGTTRVEPYHYIKTKADKTGKIYEEHCNDVLVYADMEYEWIDNEKPGNKIIVPWILVGQQSEASQAFGSALTYASRYFMLKFFNVATSDDDPESFYLKRKQAEEQADKLIVDELISKVDAHIRNYMAKKPEERENIVKIVKNYIKDADYFKIKDVATATNLLNAILEKYPEEDV